MELWVDLGAGGTDHYKSILMLKEALKDFLDDIREIENEMTMIEKNEMK